MTADPDQAKHVHTLANHVGALLLGLELLRDEPDLPEDLADVVGSLLGEARSASAAVARLQGDADAAHGED